MLNQLITTMAILSFYLIAMIILNFSGVPEEMNVFLCSIILSTVFMLIPIKRIFYYISALFLLNLAFLLQEFNLAIWVLTGLTIGYLLAPFIMVLQPKMVWHKQEDLHTAEHSQKHFDLFSN